MKKAILISIRPEWVAKILNGEKTVEIRKNMPKCDTPIDVYIYVTRGQALKRAYLYEDCVQEGDIPFYVLGCFREDNPNQYFPKELDRKGYLGNGYVIAKFTLKNADKVAPFFHWCEKLKEKSCLTWADVLYYMDPSPYSSKRRGIVYAWNISDLEVFDEPKELSDFGLKRAPQSWQYVEVKE